MRVRPAVQARRWKLPNGEVRPRRGRLVLFFPATMHGERLIEAAHAALPAVDEKWVMQCWIRQHVAQPL